MKKQHFYQFCSLICYISSLSTNQSYTRTLLVILSIFYAAISIYLALKDHE